MAEHEIGLREARSTLGDLVNRADIGGQITYITRHGRRVAAIVPINRIAEEYTMTETIASQNHGRSLPSYDLLDELQKRYGLDRRETHDTIHSFLADLGDDAIRSSRPQRPELVDHNPQDNDVDSWMEITGDAADSIREAFAVTYGTE